MNKSFIKQYQKEFMHMINGGKVLVSCLDWDTNEWWDPEDDLNKNPFKTKYNSHKYIAIIDDSFVEFRKASIEGKIIQKYIDGFVGWQNITEFNPGLFDKAQDYRIKSKDAPYKAGDWVRDTRKGIKNPIVRIKENCVALTNYEEYGTQYIKWIPEDDELCWSWNRKINKCVLAEFRDYNSLDEYTSLEPYIEGKKPSFLKD